MAQYRQSGGHHLYTNGTTPSADHVSIGIRSSQQKTGRVRRSGRSDKNWTSGFLIGAVTVFLCLVLVVTVLAYYFISTESSGEGNDGRHLEEDDMKSDADFLANVTRMDPVKVLEFGQGVIGHGRDSMYWDKDDRRRDEDYGEDDVEHARNGSSEKVRDLGKVKSQKEEKLGKDNGYRIVDRRGIGLYNEDGRKELRRYEEEYEASLKNGQQSRTGNGSRGSLVDDEDLGEWNEAGSADNEYDAGIDSPDPQMEEYGDSEHDIKGEQLEIGASGDVDGDQESSNLHDTETKNHNIGNNIEETSANLVREGSAKSQSSGGVNSHSLHVSNIGRETASKSRSEPKRKPKHRKVSGSSCIIKFQNSTTQLVEPFESRKFSRFSLQYVEMEENPGGQEKWEPRFAGHQSLLDREESFLVHDKKINCGFVKGPQGSPSTGFDLSEDDENYISKCHIAVVSCIFGNSDRLRSPVSKMVTRLSRKNVCFVMFVDEVTLRTLSSEGQMQDTTGFIGLWKIVVVKNLPYDDMRRVGKVPKLLAHRLFPSARYSIWLDSKLRLQHDPLLVLEYFLWRKGYEYAISNHYNRHCIWEEVAQNKRLNKYNHTVIDEQFSFYRADGLKRFNSSDPNKLLPSNVPEGSLIVRAHTPMSNLFSCLWFNEVDRFTPRDQLSFAYTYQKLRRMNPDRPFYLNMFKDCERRTVAKLFRHRSQEKRSTLQEEATE